MDDDDLRCESRMHGHFTEDGLLEVKCSSTKCGAGRGVVVIHTFDLSKRELTKTKRYRNPAPHDVRGTSQ